MRYLIILLAFFLSSCTEKFNTIDPAEFNTSISGRTDIKTPEDLIKLYYNYPESLEGKKVAITSKKSGDSYTITLIHEGLEDDSIEGKKVEMKAKQVGNTWQVLSIHGSFKCYQGRGHTGWGVENCR
jgi:hypothetical protein